MLQNSVLGSYDLSIDLYPSTTFLKVINCLIKTRENVLWFCKTTPCKKKKK